MKKTNAMRLLEQAGVEYEAYEYDGEGGKITGSEIAARIGKPLHLVCKTLVTATDHREYFVFVIPVEKTLDLKAAARTAGVKALAMLPLAKLFPLTGYVHGGCSPLGLKTAMPVFIDASVENEPEMFFSGGRIGLNLRVAPKALAALAGAKFAPVAG
jgi:Cys-tRNA(Pro)/Cys-tRNA(Cys) deacylase